MSTPRASVLLASALFAIGCSDAVPPAAEGAYTAKFVQKAGGMCSIKTHNDAVGAATDEDFGLIKDGTSLTDVTCIVLDEGGGSFYAEGLISNEDGARSLKFSIAGLKPGATEDEPALGTVGFRSKTTLDVYTSPGESCQFWFEGGRQQVAAGRLWVTFQCDSVSSQGSDCALGDVSQRNTIAVQNCDQ